MKVFIVYSYTEYECSFEPLRAFASREPAEALVSALREHSARRPELRLHDNDNDPDWEAHEKAVSEWESQCPVAGETDRDGYDVREIDVLP